MNETQALKSKEGCLGQFKNAVLSLSSSMTMKLVFIGFLLLLLQIPLLMVNGINEDRIRAQRNVESDIASKWGVEQCIGGPVLTFNAMEERVTKRDKHEETYLAPVAQIILPDSLDVTAVMTPEVRTRSIYQVPLHSTAVTMKGRFVIPPRWWPDAQKSSGTPVCSIGIPDPKGVRKAELTINGKAVPLAPGAEKCYDGKGFSAALNAADWQPGATADFTLELIVNGSGPLTFVPLGRNFSLALSGTWPSPSFAGNILPETREVTDKGFKAVWHITELNRDYPQSWNDSRRFKLDSLAVGASLALPANFYQQVERTHKYAALFLIIVLVSILFAERSSKTIVHPIQYFVASLAMVLFYMLLLAVAEHTSYPAAYAISTAVISLMTTGYCLAVFRKAAPALSVGALMVIAYGLIYIILQLEEFALLAGTAILLVLLAIVMALTARINRETN